MWLFNRRRVPKPKAKTGLTIDSLPPDQRQELKSWRNRVSQGDPGAIQILDLIANRYANNWTKFFGILMDLDRENIRGAAVAQLFEECKGEISSFERRIA